jgi:hypothetical protein
MKIIRWEVSVLGAIRFCIEAGLFIYFAKLLFRDNYSEMIDYCFKGTVLAFLVMGGVEFIICFCKTAYDEIRRRKEDKGY